MMTRIVWALVVGGFASFAWADDKQSAGSATWGKDYPKVNAAGVVELKGEYKPGDGWGVKEAWYDYVPVGGGVVAEKTKIAYADGAWGADTKGKIVPAEAKTGKGKWNVRVMFVFEKKLPNGTSKT